MIYAQKIATQNQNSVNFFFLILKFLWKSGDDACIGQIDCDPVFLLVKLFREQVKGSIYFQIRKNEINPLFFKSKYKFRRSVNILNATFSFLQRIWRSS